MDVIEFFSEFKRMCKSSSDCAKCQYHGDKCDNAIELFEKTVAAVEKWSQEHPRKTRQDAFLMTDLTYMDCWHYIAPLIPVTSGTVATTVYVMVFQALKEADESRKKDG